MNRLGTAIAVAIVVTLCASGCGVPRALGGSGCHKPDPEVVDAIMATAQHDFAGPGGTISRLDPVRTAARQLSSDEKFGDFTMVVAIRSNYVNADGDVMGMGNGVLWTDVFASDATGTKLAEIDPLLPVTFDIPDPEEPGFRAWAKRAMDDGGAGLEVYSCAGG